MTKKTLLKKKPSTATSSEPKPNRAALLDALEDKDEKVRLDACATLSSKFEPSKEENAELENHARKEILRLGKEGMFPSLVKCISDKSSIVRLSAVGALRNIALMGGEKACLAMQQADAWSSLLVAIDLGDKGNAKLDLAIKKECLLLMDLLCEAISSVAERRLPDSLLQLASCFRNAELLECAVRLLFRATQSNLPLAQAMATEGGRKIGAVLDHLVAFSNPAQVLTSSLAFGALVNLCLVTSHADFPRLLEMWRVQLNTALFSSNDWASVDDAVVNDALLFEESDMALDGSPQAETLLLKAWLDRMQAQTLALDVFSDCLREDAVASSIKPWLISVCMRYLSEPWCRETVGPQTLLLPAAQLQQAAAECLGLVVGNDSENTRDYFLPLVHLLKMLCVTPNRETDDRLIALATCLCGMNKKDFPLESLIQDVVFVQRTCPVIHVRALMINFMADVAKLHLIQMAPLLMESGKTEENFVVLCEILDALIDLFSEDEVQPLFDQLEGLALFALFEKQFEKRFTAWKRKEGDDYNNTEDQMKEKMWHVRENVSGFLAWRRDFKN